MPKGSSSNSGPPPDPNALRRNRPSDQATWTSLPKSGRKGPAPDWPLGIMAEREEELWGRLWKMPQAVMWELNGQELEVALHVRTFTEAEDFRATATARTLCARQMDTLGLTVTGLRMARWRIVDDTLPPEPVRPTRRSRTGKPASGARDRLRAVEDPPE